MAPQTPTERMNAVEDIVNVEETQDDLNELKQILVDLRDTVPEPTSTEVVDYETEDDAQTTSSVDSIVLQFKRVTISIPVSSVSAILNVNPFMKRDQLMKKLLSKYCENYDYQDEESEVIHNLSIHGKKFLEKIRDSIRTCKNTHELVTLTNKIIYYILEKDSYKDASNEKKAQVKRAMMAHCRKLYGTYREEETAKFVSQFGVFCKDNANYTMILDKRGPYEFILTGKIDGILKREDGTASLIEIKNRVHSIHKKLQKYEEIQVQLYLQMLKMEKAVLVEHYNQVIQTHHIEYDPEYYSKTICPTIRHFINKLYDKLLYYHNK